MTESEDVAKTGLRPGDATEPCWRPNPAHARKVIPDEVLADAKHLYETTDLPQIEIAQRVGLHRSLLYRTIRRKGWRRPDPARSRELVVMRVRAKVERALAGVEATMARTARPGAMDEAERAGRTLTALMRTLIEIEKYDERRKNASGADERDDPGLDIDRLRDALAERLDRLRDERDG